MEYAATSIRARAAVMVERVLATKEALDLIARLKRTHGPLMFHKSLNLARQGFADCS